MRHTWIAWIGTAVLTAACGTPPAQKPAVHTTSSVATAPARMTELASSVEAGGIVRARVTALIASRVMAPIVDVRVRAGDRVHRGDVLATLDARDVRANETRAQAATVSAAEAVRAAEADVRASESAVQLARLTHERIAALHDKRSATTAELDQANAALTSAEAQQTAAQARLAATRAGSEAAKATALAAGIAATYAALTAPFDGIVTERTAEPGSMTTPGSPLLTLEDPTTYRLEVRVDEARASVVARGDDVLVHLDDHDTPVTGNVVEIARLDSMSHSFLVKIDLPPAPGVRSGQFGRAAFSGSRRHAVTVPSSALVRRGQLTFVFVVDANQQVRLRPVSIGATDGERTEILAGVGEGDRVVTSPTPSLGDGDAVSGGRP